MSLKRSVIDLRNSLLFRLTVLYAATFMVLAIIGFTIFYYRIYSVTITRIDQELFKDSRFYAELLAESGFTAVRDEILNNAKSEDPEKEFYRVININGEILVSTIISTWGNVDYYRAASELRNISTEYFAQTITSSGKDNARVITARIGPTMLLQIGETLEDTEAYLDIFRELLMILIMVFIIISAVIGWYMARRSLNGMREVTQAAEDITNGEYDRRVEVAGQFRVVDRLGAAFNTMLDRIQVLLQSMQQINDNIAHDLRSPLTRIRGIAEMTLVKDKDIEDYKEMAASTIEECDVLIDMINTMLDITEIEAGVIEAKMENFDLNQLVGDACELFRPIAAAKKITLLHSHLTAPLLFNGDRKRMQRIVTNLTVYIWRGPRRYGPDEIGGLAPDLVSGGSQVDGFERHRRAGEGPVGNAEFILDMAVAGQDHHGAVGQVVGNGLGHAVLPGALGFVKVLEIVASPQTVMHFKNAFQISAVFRHMGIDVVRQQNALVLGQAFETAGADFGRQPERNIYSHQFQFVGPDKHQNVAIQAIIVFPVGVPVYLAQEGGPIIISGGPPVQLVLVGVVEHFHGHLDGPVLSDQGLDDFELRAVVGGIVVAFADIHHLRRLQAVHQLVEGNSLVPVGIPDRTFRNRSLQAVKNQIRALPGASNGHDEKGGADQ